MTTSIPLSDLPGVDTTRRDQWGRYVVVPPKGGKPVGYTRVTTIAGVLDSGGGLAPWKASMTASGIIMRHGLRARWEALLASYGDPWYASQESKDLCKELVEECAAVGGANDRKEIGSSMHTITALVDVGRTPSHLTPETKGDLAAYQAGIATAGITIIPGAVEMVTVLDTFQVAGTIDRLAQVPGFDLPLVTDLKTGGSIEYSWQSIAVQLAGYAHGEALYQQGPSKDGSKDIRHPMPAVDQNFGLIFWLPAGEARLELWLVDIVAGWEAFQHSMWAYNWRKSKPERPYSLNAIPTQDLSGALEQSLIEIGASVTADEVDQKLADSITAHPAGGITTDAQPSADVAEVVMQHRQWLQDRINEIGQAPQARKALGQLWPEGLPTLKASDAHTPEQLLAIERLLDDVERRYELKFPPPSPAVGKVVALFPGSQLINLPTDKDPA
jgi:hypothetical protein